MSPFPAHAMEPRHSHSRASHTSAGAAREASPACKEVLLHGARTPKPLLIESPIQASFEARMPTGGSSTPSVATLTRAGGRGIGDDDA
jgi:hypothetical protein